MVKARLVSQLNTWNDLLTPPEWCDYYWTLSEREQVVYRKIYAGIVQCLEYVSLDDVSFLTKERVGTIYHAILWDNPAIFEIGEYAMWEALDMKNKRIKITSLASPASYVRELRQEVLCAVKKILSEPGIYDKKEFDKELWVHDYIIEHLKYDHTLGNGGANLESYTVYGALIKKNCVCEGFAKLNKLLLDILGVHGKVVSGKVPKLNNAGHSWNVVSIGGENYHVDCTSDLARLEETDGRLLRRDYFNVTDAVMAKEHTWEWKSALGVCDSYKLNYAYLTGGYVSSLEELRIHLQKKINAGKKIIYIRLNKAKLGNIQDEHEWINQAYSKVINPPGRILKATFLYSTLIGLTVMQIEYKLAKG